MSDNSIITAAQNIAVAINNLVKATYALNGAATSTTYAGGTTTQITIGSGRLNNVTVTVDAAVSVSIYNAKATSLITASNLLAIVDASSTGTTVLNKNYSEGLVLVVGAAAEANVTYSPS